MAEKRACASSPPGCRRGTGHLGANRTDEGCRQWQAAAVGVIDRRVGPSCASRCLVRAAVCPTCVVRSPRSAAGMAPSAMAASREGVAVAEPEVPAAGLGLADYLTDLRAELDEAHSRAAGSSLRLGVDEVTVTLEVAVTTDRKASGSGKLSARFWVLNAEVGAGGERSSQRVATQQLTLTLKPRVESVTVDEQGSVALTTRGLDVSGALTDSEESPELPPLPSSS